MLLDLGRCGDCLDKNFGASIRIVALSSLGCNISMRAVDDLHKTVLDAFNLDEYSSPNGTQEVWCDS